MIEISVKHNNIWYNVSNLMDSVKWSGDYKQCCRKLEFSLISSSSDLTIPRVNLEEADKVALWENNNPIFNGIIYTINKSSSSNTIDYVAYDYGVKLNDNKVAYNVKNKTANEVVDMYLKDYLLTRGDIYVTKTRTSKVFIGVTAYDMLMTMYSEASKVDGNKYMINYTGDKLNVVKKGDIKLNVSFEEGKNLISSNYSISMENIVNKVVIVDEFGSFKDVVQNEDDKKKHGMFQEILKAEDGKDNKSIARNMLKEVEKTCSLEGYGDTSCITGYGVTVKDSFTGLVGLFYIDSDVHTWEGGEYSISLGLNFKNIMNEVNAGEDEQAKSTIDDNRNVVTVTGGKEVDCEFTAYYPANNTMEGGFLDAQGKRLDPSKLTCAAPKSVPFGTKIQVKGTGSSKDNLVYKVNDRGGRINISGGLYHIDLLVANKTEANKFGRRRGKAIIGVSESSSSSSSVSNSSVANKAVSFVKAQLGKRYVWGATGPNTFDCSGLTLCAYKSAGINIPRVSGDQSRYGKSVSKSNLQPGDLLFFDTMGKGRVSHVGMYIGNGNMIHAANPKKGVRTDSISSSYYVKTFINARRVV